jgi:ABC-2 type transport system permease protein
MLSVYLKELNAFFSSLTGYIVLVVFLLVTGLMMWVFPEYNILDYSFASLNQFFSLAPVLFLFLLPALTMRAFSEERQLGTLEFLVTQPITDLQIVLGKYLAVLTLIVFSILPTLIYYYSVYQLGSPKGNLDAGGIAGSYLGLFSLAACFGAIGLFASSLTSNQIVAFLLSLSLSFVFYYVFDMISDFPFFIGSWDLIIKKLGIDFHYRSMARGVIDTRDVVYFISVIGFFLYLTHSNLMSRKA